MDDVFSLLPQQKRKAVSDIEEQIITFLNGSVNNAWIETDLASIYVRKNGVLYYDRTLLDCFQFANINLDESIRNNGIMTDVYEWAVATMTCDAIVVESVINDRYSKFLQRTGWIADTRQGYHNFFRYTTNYITK